MGIRTRLIVLVTAVASLVALTNTVAVALRGPSQQPAQQLAPQFQPSSENLYVPITPCRIVDTRIGTGTGGTPFSSLQTRTYYVSSTFGFAAQGGKTGGCGIPGGVVAIAASFLVVSPTAGGRLHAWPNGGTEPTATTYYYGNHTGSSSATVTINPSTSYSLKVRNYSATTDVVIDVTGYYVKPLTAVISDEGELYSGSSRAISSTRVQAGVYDLRFDRNVRNCAVQATSNSSNYNVTVNPFTFSADDVVRILVYNTAGNLADAYVHVTVSC